MLLTMIRPSVLIFAFLSTALRPTEIAVNGAQLSSETAPEILLERQDLSHLNNQTRLHGDTTTTTELSDTHLGRGENKVEEAVSAKHYHVGMTALWSVIVLCSVLFYKYYFHRYKLLYLPESVAAILIGMVVGTTMVILHEYLGKGFLEFKPELFFYILLPPIIFKAGFGVEKTLFFANIGSIAVFAFFGTIISTLIIGFSLFALSKAGTIPLDSENALESLMFGTLISSTDPVSTVSIMASLDANPMLHAIIFGESVLNDAVCITLYKTLEGFHPFLTDSADLVNFSMHDLGKCMIIFLGITVVSIMLGVTFGLLCSLVSNKTPLIKNHPEIEMGMTFFVAYMCYCVGEILEMSGIMALFFCAIVLAHYHSHNLSESSRIAVESSVQAFGFVAETAVFIVLGITAITSFIPQSQYAWSPLFVVIGTSLCLISRIIQVSLLSSILNLALKDRITGQMQLVMVMAGLRGAVSFALAVQVPASSSKFMATTTLAIVVITTILMGSFSGSLIKMLGLSISKDEKEGLVQAGRNNSGLFCGACEENFMSKVFGGVERSPVLPGSPIAEEGGGNDARFFPKNLQDDEDDEEVERQHLIAAQASLVLTEDAKDDQLGSYVVPAVQA